MDPPKDNDLLFLLTENVDYESRVNCPPPNPNNQ